MLMKRLCRRFAVEIVALVLAGLGTFLIFERMQIRATILHSRSRDYHSFSPAGPGVAPFGWRPRRDPGSATREAGMRCCNSWWKRSAAGSSGSMCAATFSNHSG